MTETLKQEQTAFELQIKQVQDWWKQERFAKIKRPYTAEEGK